MGAVIEINIICSKILLPEQIEYIFNNDNIKCLEIISMADWEYHDIKVLNDFDSISSEIEDKRIVKFDFELSNITNCGVIIEPIMNTISYNIWFDTKNFADLDVDYVNCNNSFVYNEIYKALGNFIKNGIFIDYKYIAIGVESTLNVTNNVYQTIVSSKNVNVWIVHTELDIHLSEILLNEFSCKESIYFDGKIYEKII